MPVWMNNVRYGSMLSVAPFSARSGPLRRGDRCVVRTERGTELGVVVNPVPETENAGKPAGEILRLATEEDLAAHAAIIRDTEAREGAFCREKVKALNLPMKLVKVEHLFGGEKIIFYFTAAGRVDFRELVKELAREYRTRIEMRQIGDRDEARLKGDYGPCGRQLCCTAFIKEFDPISMKMAKNQMTTLDPQKLSGRCGKLKCCLKYENETYMELKSLLPRKGARVLTQNGEGEVLTLEILAQKVLIEKPGGERIRVHRDQIVRTIARGILTDEDEEDGE
jgi:cell fate regulator YaaT (PSP1 superfamily)